MIVVLGIFAAATLVSIPFFAAWFALRALSRIDTDVWDLDPED